MAHEVVGAILKQACEKIDGLREVAGSVLEKILFSRHNSSSASGEGGGGGGHRDGAVVALVAGVPAFNELQDVFGPAGSLQWNSADRTFPLMSRVLSLEPYRRFVVEGMSLSVSKKNAQSLVRAASEAFTSWVAQQQQQQQQQQHLSLIHI